MCPRYDYLAGYYDGAHGHFIAVSSLLRFGKRHPHIIFIIFWVHRISFLVQDE
jgi:hypothetical protein